VGKGGKNRDSRLHALDPKGRVAIPIDMRKDMRFGEMLVLTRGFESCIALYKKENWDPMVVRFEELAMSKTILRKKVRRIMGEFKEVEIDSHGRILLPGHLVHYAGITDSCYFIRMPRWIELWNPARYDEMMEETLDFEDLPI
jgi:MraZ protein